MWFSVFVEISKSELNLSNKRAWAGQWNMSGIRLSNEKVSQQEIAKRYGLSPSTLGKYVKLVKKHMK